MGQRVFTHLLKHYPHRKLVLPIMGPLNVTDKKGNLIQLTDKRGGNYIVHSDNIFVGIELPKLHGDEKTLK